MVPAEEPQMHQQFADCNSSNLDHMALLQLKQTSSLMYNFPPTASTADIAFVGLPTSNLNVPTTKRPSEVDGFAKLLPPHPTEKPCIKDSLSNLPQGFGPQDTVIDASCIPRKRFLIFDQSGNHTRLFFSPSFSPQNQIIASRDPASYSGICEGVATQLDGQVVKEAWDGNHLMDGEGDTPEDSEEINALLESYSNDSDGEDSDSDGENGEVNSTAHTQCHNEGSGGGKNELLEELTEDVASSGSSQKRQKLLDGMYKKKSSFLSDESPEDDVASSCARNSSVGIDSIKREKKVKIRDALQILEGIIPGLNSKDPLHIIERAIVFLKSMRIEAEALGLNSYLKHDSASP